MDQTPDPWNVPKHYGKKELGRKYRRKCKTNIKRHLN
jgi:hypothetical protein